MLKRAQRQLKDALQSRLAGDKWVLHLPWVLLGLRAAPKEDGNGSSVELVFRCPVTVPGQFLDMPELPPEAFLEDLQATGCHPPHSGLTRPWLRLLPQPPGSKVCIY
jgi:hypothetical protein